MRVRGTRSVHLLGSRAATIRILTLCRLPPPLRTPPDSLLAGPGLHLFCFSACPAAESRRARLVSLEVEQRLFDEHLLAGLAAGAVLRRLLGDHHVAEPNRWVWRVDPPAVP